MRLHVTLQQIFIITADSKVIFGYDLGVYKGVMMTNHVDIPTVSI